jgi:glycosyltransferase involved in cell wall biosynthesis
MAAGAWSAGSAGILAVIPAYNEAPRIAAVVRGLIGIGLPVLVVDDGSRDHTARVAAAAGATVLRRDNGGKGTAIITGCRWAVAGGWRRVLLIDGDGQHDPREAPILIAAGRAGADLVIGRRSLRPGRQPLYRRCFNRLSSLLVTLVAGRQVRDSQSGFRFCDPRLLLALPLSGRRYDLETEVCILSARAGLRLVEVPISVIYNDKVSGVHPLYDTLRFFRAVALSVTRCRGAHRLAPYPAMCTPAPAAPAREPAGAAAPPPRQLPAPALAAGLVSASS